MPGVVLGIEGIALIAKDAVLASLGEKKNKE
jgi:hypothetical protein